MNRERIDRLVHRLLKRIDPWTTEADVQGWLGGRGAADGDWGDLGDARSALSGREGRRAIRKGVWTPGAAPWLDVLGREGDDAEREDVRINLEILLKHVEVHGKGCLSKLDGAGDVVAERIAVARLFARAARRRGDLRLLNGALRLNDRIWPDRRRLGTLEPAWCVSLAEQERAVQELLS